LSIDKWKIEPKKPKKKKVGQLTQSVGQLTQNEATKCSISKQQQTPKETVLKETKEQQKASNLPAVFSLNEKNNSKPANQELIDQGIAFINKAFVQVRWLPFDDKTKRQLIENLILIRKLSHIFEIEDWLRAWKRYIDTKNKQKKIGYLLEASRSDWSDPGVNNRQITIPPCLEGLDSE